MIKWLTAGALLLLTGVVCLAQVPLTGAGKAGPSGGGGSYQGPGDVTLSTSSVVAWYGMRAYSAAQATAHVVMFQLSNGTNTCDFDAATSGGIRGTTSGCGAGTGVSVGTFCSGSCTVTKVYDQSGANACSSAPCDLATTITADPTITLSALGSLPAITCNGSQSIQTLSGPTSPTGNANFSFVSDRTSGSGFAAVLADSINIVQTGYTNSTTQALMFANVSVVSYGSLTEGTWYNHQQVYNGASSMAQIDATGGANVYAFQNPGNPGAGTMGSNNIVLCGASNKFPGNLVEAGIWAGGAWTSTDAGNMNSNQNAFWP